MKVSYSKLWKLLIDKKIKKTHLRKITGMGTTTLARLGRDEQVSMDILMKICSALNCTVNDILDFLPEKTDKDGLNEVE